MREGFGPAALARDERWWGIPDWRSSDDYRALESVDPQLLAWEWLRRDPGYRLAALGKADRSGVGDPWIRAGEPAAASWGLHAFEDPRLPASLARPVWTAADAFVLSARAFPSRDDGDSIALHARGGLETVVLGDRQEHLLFSDGRGALRVDIVEGSLLAGWARLHYEVSGLGSAARPMSAIRTLAHLQKSGRFGRGGPRVRPRDILLLRAFDGIRDGAGQRQLAAALLRRRELGPDWRIEQPSLRSQAQRLARDARSMAAAGFRKLLG